MTAPLHLIRSRIDTVALAAYGARLDVLDDDLGYALHHALRRRFGPAAPQPFRLMAPDPCGRRAVLMGYSTDPAALERPVALPDPEGDWRKCKPSGADAVFPDPFETRPMPTDWRAGLPLRFEVLVRPVRRHGPKLRAARLATGKTATGTEHDAFLSAVERLDRDTHDRTRESVYLEWLAERLGDAAVLDGATLESFRRTRVFRGMPGKGGRTRRGIEGPEALIQGRMIVRDPAAFAPLLSRGLGRHGAFGYGMLLLRPGP
jgi:CRISPR system Cascade subunit CasE